jgi:hypothetical protein
MKMHLVRRDSIPARRTVKRNPDAPEARYRTDGTRIRLTGYDTLIREFQRGSDSVVEVRFSDGHPDTIYHGLLSACHDMPAPEIDVMQRGTRVYLTRGADTDKIARAERREAVRDTLHTFDASGAHTERIDCTPEDFPALYALFQKQRTAQGLGNVRVGRAAGLTGIVLTNTMVD